MENSEPQRDTSSGFGDMELMKVCVRGVGGEEKSDRVQDLVASRSDR